MTRQIITPPHVEAPGSTRCGPSIILMILKHFLPEKEWTFDDADRICGYIEGKWTWSTACIPAMIELGFEAINFSTFDNNAFIENPEQYLVQQFGPEKAKINIDKCDIPMIVDILKTAKGSPYETTVSRNWQWDDVDRLLSAGYLLFTWVNSRALLCRQDESFSGHFVLVYGYNPEKKYVLYHDAGGEMDSIDEGKHERNRFKGACFGIDHFMNAAKDENGDGGLTLIAFRLREQ